MFVLGMIAVSVYGWSKGNVRKLIAPIARRPQNVVCGFDDAKDFPYLFFLPIKSEVDFLKSTYCVDKCTVESEKFKVYYPQIGNPIIDNVYVNTTTVGYICIPTDQDILDQAGELLLQATNSEHFI